MSYTIQISLFQSSAEPTVVNKMELTETNQLKYLTLLTEILGAFKEEQDITAPVLDISCNDKGMIDNILNKCNYAYIFELKKCYFITKKITGLNNIITLYLNEDVLTTWKEEIYKLKPLVTRQATDYDKDLYDAFIPIESLPDISITSYQFSSYRHTDNHETKASFGDSTSYIISTFVTNSTNFPNIIYSPKGCSTCFTPSFSLSAFQLSLFSQKCFDDTFIDSLLKGFFTNISDYVNSLLVVPWGIAQYGAFNVGQNLLSTLEIPIANSVVKMTDNDNDEYPVEAYLHNNVLVIPFNDISIPIRKFHNFIDYTITIEIYVPFNGWITIDNKLLLNSTTDDTIICYGYYFIDPSTLQYTFILTKQNLNLNYTTEGEVTTGNIDTVDYSKIITSCTGTMGGNCPWGSNNKTQIYRNLLVGGITTAAGIIAGAPSLTAAGIMQSIGGESPAITKAQKRLQDKRISRPETIAARQSDLNSAIMQEVGRDFRILTCNAIKDILPNITPSGGLTSSGSIAGNSLQTEKNILVRVTTPVPVIPDNYYELYGGVCNLTVELSTLKGKGFTKCANIHMTGFTSATLEEINEIESLLLSGVIL